MSFTKRIVCLAASDKERGLCIAGREIMPHGYGAWIRPVSARPKGELSWSEYRYADFSCPELLDIIDIPLLEPAPAGHQRENQLIDSSSPWVKQGQIAFSDLDYLKETPFSLWTNTESTNAGLYDCVSPEVAATHNCSLHLVSPISFLLKLVPDHFTGRRRYIGEFDIGRHRYWLNVTDPEVKRKYKSYSDGEYRLSETAPLYLCVSLTERFTGDGRCHKLIASVLADTPLSRVA